MRRCLLKMAQEKTNEATDKFETRIKQLDERPKELSKFAAYVQTYSSVLQELGDLEFLMEDIETMYALLRKAKVKLSTDDQVAEENLKTMEHEFTHSKMVEAKKYIDEQQAKMAEETYQKSLEIEEKMREIQETLQVGDFVDAEKIGMASEVLEELERIGEKQVKYLEERAQTCSEYEGLLGSAPKVPAGETFEFQDLEKGKKLFQQKWQLWDLAHQWQDMSGTWLTSDFRGVDVEEMAKKVNASNKTAFNLSKALEGDEVVAQVKNMIDEYKEKMPTGPRQSCHEAKALGEAFQEDQPAVEGSVLRQQHHAQPAGVQRDLRPPRARLGGVRDGVGGARPGDPAGRDRRRLG